MTDSCAEQKEKLLGEKIEAVLFDLDGTLINTLYSLQDTMNQVMRMFGCDEISLEQTKQYVGYGYQVFVEKSLQATADRLLALSEKWEEKDEDKAFEYDQQADEVLENYDEACEAYLKIFEHNFLYQAEAYEGMKETLAGLRAAGYHLGVVTNKPVHAAEQALDAVFGAGYFDYVSADDGTHPLKPDRGVIDDACAHLGTEPAFCVYVGDTKTDIQTAKNTGMRSIGCVYGFRGREELEAYGADALADSAADILKLLTK